MPMHRDPCQPLAERSHDTFVLGIFLQGHIKRSGQVGVGEEAVRGLVALRQGRDGDAPQVVGEPP
eukprot:1595056-Pyramimonas_sp.AAC.1